MKTFCNCNCGHKQLQTLNVWVWGWRVSFSMLLSLPHQHKLITNSCLQNHLLWRANLFIIILSSLWTQTIQTIRVHKKHHSINWVYPFFVLNNSFFLFFRDIDIFFSIFLWFRFTFCFSIMIGKGCKECWT